MECPRCACPAVEYETEVRCSNPNCGWWGKLSRPAPPPPPTPTPTPRAVQPWDSSRTVAEARAELEANLDAGHTCEVCGQLAKRYRRKLSARMARWLIALAKLTADGSYVHAREVFGERTRGSNADDYNYLQHWGLAQPAPSDPEEDIRAGRKPGRNGEWRITPRGLEFVHGRLCVPQKVRLLPGNRLEGFDGEEIDIRAALGSRFNYAELMGDPALEGFR